ncbi:hypothetical protein ACGTJS_09825 [Faucicola mancuniensis]|uniref:hypothetical protein n=1 Tax=Faucicola mancuniensis TaxID=1309795 RepID=UPI003977BB6C
MNILQSHHFNTQYPTWDIAVRQAIAQFIDHVETHGFKGLKGRNKSSAIESTTKKGMARFKTAQKHCLWHYHIGLPEYVEQANGEFTSEMVLHYMRLNDCVVLVDVATHPPFNLPSNEKLNY